MHIQFNTAQIAHRKSFHPAKELTLCEMLDDPIVQDVMRSGRVSRAEVLAAFKLNDCRKLQMAA